MWKKKGKFLCSGSLYSNLLMNPEAVNVSVFNSAPSRQAADVQFAPLHRQPQQIRIICLSYTERSKPTQSPTQRVTSNSSNISSWIFFFGLFFSASFAIFLTLLSTVLCYLLTYSVIFFCEDPQEWQCFSHVSMPFPHWQTNG